VASRYNARPLASTASPPPSISLSCLLTTSTARGSRPRQTSFIFFFHFKAAKFCKILEAQRCVFLFSSKRKIFYQKEKYISGLLNYTSFCFLKIEKKKNWSGRARASWRKLLTKNWKKLTVNEKP
jgi:hypothetical protein